MFLYMHFYHIASIQMDDNLYKRENRVKDRREERGLWPEKKKQKLGMRLKICKETNKGNLNIFK